jgi:hypothetical protein
MLSERGTYCGAFQTLLSGGAGRPVMIHELGASSAQYAPERIAAFDRATLYSSLAAGANGFLLWCYTDAAPETYRRAPYLRAPHETQFGLTTWDRQDRPAGVELRKFSQLVAQMDLTGIEPETPQAAVIVPHEWAAPQGSFSRLGLSGPSVVPYVSTQEGGVVTSGAPVWTAGHEDGETNLWLVGAWLSTLILARRAGLKVAFPREYSEWQKAPLLFLPSPLTSTERNFVHVHTRFWEQVRAYVKDGGAVYASLCADAAVPEMADLFGARLADHSPVEAVTLTLVNEFGGLQPGETFRFTPTATSPKHWPATLELDGGQVIATDQEGRPALVANSAGPGKTLLCAYPLESYLAVQPAAFEGSQDAHRIYQAFRRWAGIEPLFQSNQPGVEVAALAGQTHGYTILASHSDQPLQVTLSSRLAVRDLGKITHDSRQDLTPIKDQTWSLQIDAYEGAILEWRL